MVIHLNLYTKDENGTDTGLVPYHETQKSILDMKAHRASFSRANDLKHLMSIHCNNRLHLPTLSTGWRHNMAQFVRPIGVIGAGGDSQFFHGVCYPFFDGSQLIQDYTQRKNLEFLELNLRLTNGRPKIKGTLSHYFFVHGSSRLDGQN